MLTLRMHSSRTSTRCRRTTPHTTSSSQRAPTAALPLRMSEPDLARNTRRRSRRFPSSRGDLARGNCEIGQKPISNPKSEISDWTVVQLQISDYRFRISDLRCRIRPISKFPRNGARLVEYVDALYEEGNSATLACT